MKRRFARYVFETAHVVDRKRGFQAVELFEQFEERRLLVARVIFWDAEGQFSLETCGKDVPLVVVEELIAEAKAAIKTL